MGRVELLAWCNSGSSSYIEYNSRLYYKICDRNALIVHADPVSSWVFSTNSKSKVTRMKQIPIQHTADPVQQSVPYHQDFRAMCRFSMKNPE